MDENSFDRLIRNKLGDYEDPVYDESAFDQFHQNYAALTHTSWFNRYRTEIIVISALLFFTLLNGWLLLPGKSINDPKPAGVPFAAYEQKIDSLVDVIEAIQTANSVAVIQGIVSAQGAQEKQNPVVIYKTTYIEDEPNLYQDTILLGATKLFTVSQISALRHAGEISIEDGKIFYIRNYTAIENNASTVPIEFTLSENRIDTFAYKNTALVNNDNLHEKDLSTKTKNALEKHYFPGIGINIAPRAGIILNAFDKSSAFFTPGVGLALDFIISPHLSIESAFEYGTTRFKLSEDLESYGIPNEPYYDFGPPDNVTITGRNISLPISLKYRRWISPKTEFVLRGSATPYYLTGQEYIYSYSDKGGGYGSPTDPAPTITKTVNKDGGLWSGTTVGVSVGLQKLYNEKQKIEASLFAEQGIQKMKPQKIGMQLFGLKAAYWFRVK